jgi:hypothetical protein
MFYSETGGHVLTPDFVTNKIGAKKRGDRRSTVGNRSNGATVRDRPMTSVSLRIERAGVPIGCLLPIRNRPIWRLV